MVLLDPVFVADRCRVSNLFIKQFFKIELICSLFDSFPEFQNFLYMLMNLITSCPAIVDDTFLKKWAAHGKCLSSELRRDDSVLPVEVHIRKVDS